MDINDKQLAFLKANTELSDTEISSLSFKDAVKLIKTIQNPPKVKQTRVKKVVEKKNTTIVTETIKVTTKKSNPIAEYESRFKEVANLDGDLTIYPLDRNNPNHHLQVTTNKDKSDKHGEVFTPLWLVDEMLEQTEFESGSSTLDLCSGYGQFTIRMLRKRCETATRFGKKAIEKFLNTTHNFAEFQFSSCYKLLYIFGREINLFIGDARHLSELDDDASGIMVYHETNKQWISITDELKSKLFDSYSTKNEEKFCDFLKEIVS